MRMASGGRFAQVKPKLVERACGGWLAISEPYATLKIGVVAPTEIEATRRFEAELLVWGRLFEESTAA
jgi:hypothetical protein